MLSCCEIIRCLFVIIFCKHKTAYEMRISDWSSDVCSSDLLCAADEGAALIPPYRRPGESRRRKVRKSPAGSLRRGLLCPRGRPGLRRAVRQCGEEQDRHDIGDLDHRVDGRSKNGRASCGESVCQYVEISVVAVEVKKKIRITSIDTNL